MKVLDHRGRTAMDRGRNHLDMLKAAGIDPREVGKIFNRAAPANTDAADGIEIPDTPAKLEEMLGDSATMAKLVAAGPRFGDFIKAYARMTYDRDLSISTQVQEQVQAVLGEMARNGELEGTPAGQRPSRPDLRGAADRIAERANARSALDNPRALGAPLNGIFADYGDFFHTMWHGADQSSDVQNKRSKARNAFSSTVPSEGGFLIPEVLRSELLRVSLETSIVRPRARVIPMESLRVPFPAVDSTSNASSVYGGIVGYWTEEGGALTVSQAKFNRVVLEAKKLTAYTEIPNELLQDSVGSFQAFLDQIFPEALGFYEDDAFMNGNGVGMPLGFLNAANLANISVTAEAGQPVDTIVWENLVKMYARMLPGSLGRAAWVASIDTFPELATMALAVGTGGGPIWLNNGVSGPPMTILGRPVIFTEKAPKLGDLGDINFVDLGYYLVGDRQAMSAMSSPHFKFNTDVTAYRIIERVDGRPWLLSPITPKNAGATLSAFVQLTAR